jgi:hypothetical protein
MLDRVRNRRVREPGSWSDSTGRPRVLVESPDAATSAAYAGLLEQAGFAVASCPGPVEGADHVNCPLLEGQSCPLVEGTDVVVTSADLAHGREILERLVQTDGVAVVFEAPAPSLGRFGELPSRTTVMPTPVTGRTLLEAVARARSASA